MNKRKETSGPLLQINQTVRDNGMKHCKMYYAGYIHLSCDSRTHIHRLLNLQTRQVELWRTVGRTGFGIPYKNTFLAFLTFEHDIKGRGMRCSM